MYLPLHQLRIPHGNIRRAGITIVVALLSFVLFLVARFFGFHGVEYYALQVSLIAQVLSVAFAVPYMMAAVVVLLSPAALYLFFDSASLPMVSQWWFWLFAAGAIAIGIWLLTIAGKKYPRRRS